MGRRILHAFGGASEGAASPCDESLHQASGDAKGGRAFGCIQRGQTPARAGAHINQPAALFDGFGNDVYGACDRGELSPYCFGDEPIFAIDDLEELARSQLIEPARARIAPLGGRPVRGVFQGPEFDLPVGTRSESEAKALHAVVRGSFGSLMGSIRAANPGTPRWRCELPAARGGSRRHRDRHGSDSHWSAARRKAPFVCRSTWRLR